MISYKRIMGTVGENFSKDHLTRVQGGAAELVAMYSTFLADPFGRPASSPYCFHSMLHSGWKYETSAYC